MNYREILIGIGAVLWCTVVAFVFWNADTIVETWKTWNEDGARPAVTASPTATHGPAGLDATSGTTGAAHEPDDPSSTSPAVVEESADDPDAVADAVAAALVSVDTAVDAAPTAAVDRAAAWMTPQLATLLEDSAQGAGASWWEELSEHQGATTARVQAVEDSGQPADTDTTAYRVRWVERVPTSADGWEGEVYGQTLFLTMTRAGAGSPWLVSDVTAG